MINIKLVDKTERWSMGNKTFVGKKKKFEVHICYSIKSIYSEKEFWYFTLSRKEDDIRYNSLWDNIRFNDKDGCVEAAEKKIEELIKSK